MMVERGLTYEQCKKIAKAPERIKEGKIKVSVLTSVDLAMCVSKVSSIVKAFEEALKPNERVQEYYEKVNSAKGTLAEKDLKESIRKLNQEYMADLQENWKLEREFNQLALEKTYNVKLPGIDVQSFDGDSEYMPEVIEALLPILTKDGELLLPKETETETETEKQ